MVDYELAVLTYVGIVLRRNGYVVIEASTAKTGLNSALKSEAQIQLLITEVAMPLMAGLSLARKIRLFNPEVAVLFISGQPRSDEFQGIANSAYLEKPFSPTQLLEVVQRMINDPKL